MIDTSITQGKTIIRPQSGPQLQYLASNADILIYGGSAGSGKTYATLLDALRGVSHPKYNAVIFRREMPQITMPGSLWDTASNIYPAVGGIPREYKNTYVFPSGATIRFTHLQLESDKFKHQGSQYVACYFDEGTHFTETQIWYLWTRCRPPAGYTGPSRMRITCNPDADHWLRRILDWWIDGETGYPIPERSGKLRYFTRENDEVIWVDKDWRDILGNPAKTITFIPGTIEDNKELTKSDPTYRSNLMAQEKVTRERLLKGNWNITHRGGMFDPTWFRIEDDCPRDIKLMRYWDLAGTEKKKEDDDPDWTAGALAGFDTTGQLWIIDMKHFRHTPAKVEQLIRQTAEVDGHDVAVAVEEEKGGSGKYVSSHFQRNVLKGFEVHPDPVSGDKIDRAKPWCALAEQGHVHIVRGEWNRDFLSECGSFPLAKKDQVDAVSGCVKLLAWTKRVLFSYIPAEYGHLKPFSKTEKDFSLADPGEIRIYAIIYAEKDGGIYALFVCWSRKSKKLRVYNELCLTTPVLSHMPTLIRDSLVVPTKKNNDMLGATLTRIYGNDACFKGGYDVKKVLRKDNIRIKRNIEYDEAGAILLANRMISNNQVIIHTDCVETDIQIRSWVVENGRPVSGYPLCRALLIILSELRVEGELREEKEPPPYSKYKRNIRDKLKRMGAKASKNMTGTREYDWLTT